jgi:hypothetical protein
MTYEISSTIDGEPFSFETEHQLDAETMQILEDLFSPNNDVHWLDGDVMNFFATQGRIVTGGFSIKQMENINTVQIPVFLTDRNAGKIGKLIVCVYDSKENLEGLANIINTIWGFLPGEKTEMQMGHIVDEKSCRDGIVVKLIAILNDLDENTHEGV